MTARAWLRLEAIAAVLYSLPAVLLALAGAQHVAHYGQSWFLYLLSTAWFWGPGLSLAAAVLIQARTRWVRAGWWASAAAVVVMSFCSGLALLSFVRQGGGWHWTLVSLWAAAGAASVAATVAVAALSGSRAPDGASPGVHTNDRGSRAGWRTMQ